ncbi:hypothetical protein RF11_00629 [Thelohanellus kitauei]|uniref:Uncharacterized protein n=1 Tax=Thelohanellus kitauei TaxID=669202 RepID=A0A0C2MW64_THEKT|nr:hypothetical protein RF11_08099 [Thelohanellus kitauei]KII65867.1 hypothetical protein RF11_00629 [Thelohanellus kitauei]
MENDKNRRESFYDSKISKIYELEPADKVFQRNREQNKWGPRFDGLFVAKSKCHPNYLICDILNSDNCEFFHFNLIFKEGSPTGEPYSSNSRTENERRRSARVKKNPKTIHHIS